MAVYDVFTPKHHIIYHLLHKMGYQGNPRNYATWLDESLNKLLKRCCRETSVVTFERCVLARMRSLLCEKGSKRPRCD